MIVKRTVRKLDMGELADEFRDVRGQSTQYSAPVKGNKKPSTQYENFYRKYTNLEESIDSFGVTDLVYYFREIAKENGHRYVITNIVKDKAVFKRVLSNYSVREVCAMIEFIFESDQDYLDKDRTTPNVLYSAWVNTIYADMNLWLEDKYVPKSKKTKQHRGEWNSDSSSDDSVVGLKL